MTNSAQSPLTFALFPEVPSFSLVSHDIAEGGTLANSQVANIMGYDGENRSPHLVWSNAPDRTLSYAVTIHDPDAPTGSGFWHWVVANIPSTVTELPTDAALALPVGALQVRNDAGHKGYVGAAPPHGLGFHRYVHTVHALDVTSLEIDDTVSPALVGFNLRFHAIARAQIVALFGS